MLHIFPMWSLIVTCWSNHTPRFRRDITGLIIASPTDTVHTNLSQCLREPMIINSVLESLMKSRFDTIQLRTSAIDFSIILTAFSWQLGLNDTYDCVSSAQVWMSFRCLSTTSQLVTMTTLNSPDSYIRNYTGPRQLPWGTPEFSWKQLDKCCLILCCLSSR